MKSSVYAKINVKNKYASTGTWWGDITNLYSLLNKEITQQELLNYYNATIVYDNLPNGINGLVFSYKNINTIIISNTLSYYKKKKAILHELAHIELNQLNQSNKDLFAFYVNKYEDEADKFVKFLILNGKEMFYEEK